MRMATLRISMILFFMTYSAPQARVPQISLTTTSKQGLMQEWRVIPPVASAAWKHDYSTPPPSPLQKKTEILTLIAASTNTLIGNYLTIGCSFTSHPCQWRELRRTGGGPRVGLLRRVPFHPRALHT